MSPVVFKENPQVHQHNANTIGHPNAEFTAMILESMGGCLATLGCL